MKKSDNKSEQEKDKTEDINTDNNEKSENDNNTGEQESEKEIQVYKDTLLRKVAEFENYKRRTETEISNYIKYASEHLISALLPVFDDLTRSVESIEKGETNDFETLKQGVIAIYDKFKKTLSEEGLTEIDILGKEFDVNTCDALLQVPRDDVKPHTVVEVVEKGYKLKDKVIRFAKVIVSDDKE